MENLLGFVVLNYNGDQVTINCVKSLLEHYPKSIICIVDNNSTVHTIDHIKEVFKNSTNIKILKANKNYGFAIGNNIGITYLREKDVKYIAVVNNDTIFQSDNLLLNLNNLENDIGVVSLQLNNKDNTKQIPYGLIKNPYKDYIKTGLLNFFILTKIFYVAKFIKNLFVRHKKLNSNVNINYNNYDFIISGAAFILTPNFFKHYNQLFNKTFLYCEEHILSIYLKKSNLKTKLINDSKIIHLESQTAQLSSYSKKKLINGLKSWWKGLGLLFKSSKTIAKKYSDRNYKYEIIK